jgi:hypothetical protein
MRFVVGCVLPADDSGELIEGAGYCGRLPADGTSIVTMQVNICLPCLDVLLAMLEYSGLMVIAGITTLEEGSTFVCGDSAREVPPDEIGRSIGSSPYGSLD